ncbi:MAG: dephospho-CoA kinase [Acidimicrobiales bacterium]
MTVVGLTGGIGSGKSTAAATLAALGADVIDADDVAHRVIAPGGAAHDRVLERFATVDRSRLAALVFADRAAMADLNAIVHPAVRAEILGWLDRRRDKDPPAVLVIPLLVESPSPYPLDSVWVIDCPEALALNRLVDGRGMSRSDALARMAAQASRAERRAAADVVIVNDGTPEQLHLQIEAQWDRLAGASPATGAVT